MSRQFHTHAARALLLTVFVASACTTAGSYQSYQPMGHRVLVDGVSVSSHHQNLLDLVTARTPVFRLVGNPNAQPLVIMDGIRMRGSLTHLEDVRVTDVRSVRFVRPVDATFLYGGDASNGAIVIESMRGR